MGHIDHELVRRLREQARFGGWGCPYPVEDSYGYEAGQMRANGTIAPLAHDADMALIKRSATIARSYAMQLEKGGNKGSAAYYRGKAEEIDAMLLGE
jgi:hypothetical protein